MSGHGGHEGLADGQDMVVMRVWLMVTTWWS